MIGSFTIGNAQDSTELHSYRFVGDGVNIKLYVDDVLESTSPGLTTGNFGGSQGIDTIIGSTTDSFGGTIYDVIINNGTSNVGQWNGYGNTNADWTDQIGSNNGTVAGSPQLLRVPADSAAPTLDVYGDTLTNPAVANSHNDAETTWDVYNIGTGDVPCPESNSNSGLSAIAFDADLTADDSAYMHLSTSVLNDRLIAFSADLTGGDKTLAEKYTE